MVVLRCSCDLVFIIRRPEQKLQITLFFFVYVHWSATVSWLRDLQLQKLLYDHNYSNIFHFIHSFIHQWLYSPLLGPGLFFSFVIFFTQTVGLLGRVISTSQGRYLHTGQHKQNKRTETFRPSVGFEPMISAFEGAKIVHALDRAATVISN
jgi:hypothetical protein